LSIFALIPAAGRGTRIGTELAKQYQPVAGRPLIAWSLEAFAAAPSVAATYVVLAPDDALHAQLGLPGLPLYTGAATRHGSVLNALDALAGKVAEDDWIMVHDAARPGLTPALIEQLIHALKDDAVGGLLALPLADTLKREQEGRSAATLPRAGLWQAQTPQMFRYGLLRRALRAAMDARVDVTDEASAIEAAGLAPRLVPGSLRNFKVTWPDDLALAQQFLREQP